MTNYLESKPNELLYIPLCLMKPFIDHLKIPKKQLEREITKISIESNPSTLPEVIFDQVSGSYLVVGGYTTYYAFKKLHNPNRLVPCKAFYELEEEYRYYQTLEWIMKNNVTDWYDRHFIIKKLVDDFEYMKNELARNLGRVTRDIQFYLDPPLSIKEQTIRQKKERLINKISLEAFKNQHNKDYLYILVLYFGEHITDEQLKFIGWIRSNGVKFEEHNLSIEQEHYLIDRALQLKEGFLTEMKRLIKEMRDENGK